MRIVAHDPAKQQARAFDFLRTQVTQAMLSKDWLILGITSPTPGCGKTFTAMNLALSMARQPDSGVLLIDLDLAKPQIAHRFGLTPSTGVRAALKEPRLVNEAVTRISVGELDLSILPCERPSSRPSDLISSTQMSEVVQRLRSEKKFKIIIFDLPPVLTGDDVIAALPLIDCVLLIAAAGTTRDAEIKECGQYLSSTPVVRVVLNKLDSAPLTYY
jgi:Mrp family chromosome partitioning ATPase